MRRATISKRIATISVLAIVGGVGCSEVLGLSGSPDASVAVDHFAEQDSLTLTIRNEGSGLIFYRSTCTADVQTRAGMIWMAGSTVPFGKPVYCVAILVPPVPVEPNSEHRIERSDLESWAPGEYRFKLDLRDEDDDLLSDDARTSNTFRIEE